MYKRKEGLQLLVTDSCLELLLCASRAFVPKQTSVVTVLENRLKKQGDENNHLKSLEHYLLIEEILLFEQTIFIFTE